MQKISLSKPYISQKAIKRVVDVLESSWLTQGPVVADFENEFKQYIGTTNALAVNSATSGLHIALLSLGIGTGDEVIVPAFSWVATANAVELCGAKPVFVDIDLDTLNANPEQILLKVTDKTKAIILVHLFGKAFDVQALKDKLPDHVAVVEDAACAAGAKINGKYCGSIGDIGVFSFHPRKSITTGEGGMVVTNNSKLYHHMSMLRNHGQDTEYREDTPAYMFDCPLVGLNYRMTDFQAALGIEQLYEIDDLIRYRDTLANRYLERLNHVANVKLPSKGKIGNHSWQSFVVLLDNVAFRDNIMQDLKNNGIETRPGTHAIHCLKYYRDRYDFKSEDYPNVYKAFRSSISLPLHNHMTIDDVDYVSQKLTEVLSAYK
jgi:perosamine synthetase